MALVLAVTVLCGGAFAAAGEDITSRRFAANRGEKVFFAA